jgi:hypothetical protein
VGVWGQTTICIFICHCLKIYYYFTLTAARTLIILTIFTDVCLFLIISRHESCDIVHLPYEVSLIVPLPPRGCVCILQTRPYFAIAFFPHACVLHSPSLICEPFFSCSNFGRMHLKFLLPFHIVPSFHVPCILLPALVFIHVSRLI